jgi:hypothetical protein
MRRNPQSARDRNDSDIHAVLGAAPRTAALDSKVLLKETKA